MNSVYNDVKRIALRQAPILSDLFRSYFKRDAARFLMQSETPLATRSVSTLCLIAMFACVCVIYVFLNPLVENFSLIQASRQSLVAVAMILVSSLPLYVVIRPRTGIRSLSFFLNLQLVSSIVVYAVSFLFVILGILLSPNFGGDIREIAKGGGKNTVLYRTFCNDLEFQRDTLIMQRELNRATGEYDRPYMKRGLPDLLRSDEDLDNEMLPYIQKDVERERQLPEAERLRIQALRAAINGRVLRHAEYSAVLAEYPYYFYLYLAVAFVMVPVASLITYRMIWKIFVSSGRSRQRKGVMRARVLAGVFVSIAFSLWFFNAAMNQTLYVRWSLEKGVQKLHADAQMYAWCRLDPRGLW